MSDEELFSTVERLLAAPSVDAGPLSRLDPRLDSLELIGLYLEVVNRHLVDEARSRGLWINA